MDGLRTAAESCRWRVGQYVVMPDHIHFLCAPRDRDGSLSAFVGWYKAWVTREAWRLGVQGRLWQPEFFDHLLRSALLYQQKWEYVRLNPVRAGLVQAPDEWPYSGQVDAL
jgi:REP element-mobilizing transposase RayT